MNEALISLKFKNPHAGLWSGDESTSPVLRQAPSAKRQMSHDRAAGAPLVIIPTRLEDERHEQLLRIFAGGGMARAGLGEGWNCIFANDISEKKAQSYCSNWSSTHLTVADVFNLTTQQLPGRADLAWGSFPCQDLSLADHGRGLGGECSGAFRGFWSLMQRLNAEGRKPRVVVLENVYGTLTSHEGKDFEQIAKAVTGEGYVFGAVVVDAVHFTAQSCPRLFIIGVDATMRLPTATVAEQPSPA